MALPDYNANGATVISWGEKYTMTWEFFAKYVDEVYAIADHSDARIDRGRSLTLCAQKRVDHRRDGAGASAAAPPRAAYCLTSLQPP